MGLIQCPDCSNQVSDSASSCPKCGRPKKVPYYHSFWFPDYYFIRLWDPPKKGSKADKILFWFKVGGLLLFLIILIAGLYIYSCECIPEVMERFLVFGGDGTPK
jgi:hypothetical protein